MAYTAEGAIDSPLSWSQEIWPGDNAFTFIYYVKWLTFSFSNGKFFLLLIMVLLVTYLHSKKEHITDIIVIRVTVCVPREFRGVDFPTGKSYGRLLNMNNGEIFVLCSLAIVLLW